MSQRKLNAIKQIFEKSKTSKEGVAPESWYGNFFDALYDMDEGLVTKIKQKIYKNGNKNNNPK